MPNYSGNPLHAYAIEDRMKQLGRLDRYQKELAKITHANDIPSEWALTGSTLSGCDQGCGKSTARLFLLRKSGGEK